MYVGMHVFMYVGIHVSLHYARRYACVQIDMYVYVFAVNDYKFYIYSQRK